MTADDPVEMTDAVVELVTAMLERNGLSTDDLISVVFTSTPDLKSAFPAAAARTLGIGDVPLLCAQELDIDGGASPGGSGPGPRRARPATGETSCTSTSEAPRPSARISLNESIAADCGGRPPWHLGGVGPGPFGLAGLDL